MEHPIVEIRKIFIIEAEKYLDKIEVKRDKNSPIDTLAGAIGEIVFAHYFFGNYLNHNLGKNKGKADFRVGEKTIEIKTGALPYRDSLHLLAREDYVAKRVDDYYVQIIIDMSTRLNYVPAGSRAYIAGWAFGFAVSGAPKRYFGGKNGGNGGYKCHYIPLRDLHHINSLKLVYAFDENKEVLNAEQSC